MKHEAFRNVVFLKIKSYWKSKHGIYRLPSRKSHKEMCVHASVHMYILGRAYYRVAKVVTIHNNLLTQ